MKHSEKLTVGAKILASKLTGRPRPFFVQYALANACDARCVYCNTPSRYTDQLTTQQVFGVLAELARLGAVRVKYHGGEPLVRQDLTEILDETRRLGMRTAIVTNGLKLARRLDAVRHLDDLIISIDGRQEAHDAQRGKGTWKRTMQGIEAAAAEKVDIFLTAVVTKKSLGEVDWLLETATRFGVKVNFQVLQTNEEMFGRAARDWMLPPEEFRSVLSKIIAAKQDGAPVLFSEGSYRRTLEWADFDLERMDRPGEPTPCTAGKYFLVIEPNGDIYPCVLHVGSFEPKNVLRDGVEEAWKHSQRHSCFGCYNTWLNENRAIFDLDPRVLYNFWSNYMRPRRYHRAAG